MAGEYCQREFQKNSYIITHVVEDSHDGWRADLYLKSRLKRKSRAYIQRSIESGMIRMVARPIGETPRLKPSTILLSGDRIEIHIENQKPEPEVDFGYKILFEDEEILVIDKPGNLPVHPAGRFFFNTLLSRLRHERFDNMHAGGDFFLIHRIDRETSGVLLIGKTHEMAGKLVAQFRHHKVEKKYFAVVHGRVEADEFAVDKNMQNDPTSHVRLKMAVCGPNEGMTALTRFRVVKRVGDYSLVECSPLTGRQHQIRVHLASAGHPLVGDKLYGRHSPDFFLTYLRDGVVNDDMRRSLVIKRHALHAYYLKFFHPTLGRHLEIESPLPEELSVLIHEQTVQV